MTKKNEKTSEKMRKDMKKDFEENLEQLKEIANLHKQKMRKITYLIIFGNFFIIFVFLVILWAFGYFG